MIGDEANIIWVQVTLVVNDVEVSYASSVNRDLWRYPEFQIDIIKWLKAKALDAATAGMEPEVEVFDAPPLQGMPIPELATGDSVQIGARR